MQVTKTSIIREVLADENSQALTADGLDSALVGIARRCGQPTLAVYDIDKCIEHFISEGMSHEEAVEYFEFNVVGAWMGEHTPLYCDFNLTSE